LKRPADAPHAESLLCADPPTVDRTITQEPESFERSDSFPASTFNFSFPPYEGILDLPGAGTVGPNDYANPIPTSEDNLSTEERAIGRPVPLSVRSRASGHSSVGNDTELRTRPSATDGVQRPGLRFVTNGGWT
jgi:GATA-binding protein, other eukaryote